MSSPKSHQQPHIYIQRSVFRFADPTGFMPEQWRLIAKEPINCSAIRFITREISALAYTITSTKRKDSRIEELTESFDSRFDNGEGFQVWLTRIIDDLCTLPFGGASEVDPSGKLEWVVHVDAATLLPTYVPKKPIVQVHPDNWQERVFFDPNVIRRIRTSPRSDIRYKEYQRSPTEESFLEIEALAKIYIYYMQQLTDSPPPGLLALPDWTADEAGDWADSYRELIEGVDAIKIPILYDYKGNVTWIPFSQTPNDLNIVEQFKRFVEILLSKYGLSIGDLRLFEHEQTKAGSGISQLVTERSGIGYWASLISSYINRFMPDGLKFEFKQPRPERELIVAQRHSTQLAMLQTAAGGSALITREDALEQATEWGIFSVETTVPEEKEELPPKDEPKIKIPTKEDLKGTKEVSEELKGLEEKALLDDPLAQFFSDQFVEAGQRAKLEKILSDVRATIIDESITTKSTDEIDTLIDELLEKDDWWAIPADEKSNLIKLLDSTYKDGLNLSAEQIEMLRRGLSEPPYLAIDWNVSDPKVLELIDNHAAEAVVNVNNGTKSYLRTMIKQLVEEGVGTTEGVKRLQTDIFGLPTGEASKFTSNRIRSILNYEKNKAMSGAAHLLRDELGLKLKQWFTSSIDPCDLCLWNEAQGVVPSDFKYRGVFGDILHPPAHPQTCRCGTVADAKEVSQLGKFSWPLT